MPEQSNIIGERWTQETVALLSMLGWKLHGTPNFDITCSRHKKERKGQPHGIDALFSYYEPYLGNRIPVIVESKSRQWQSINKTEIEKWLNQLLFSLECAPEAPELHDFNLKPYNTGLLCIWCNDNKYDRQTFLKYLSALIITQKKIPYRTFILSNYEILRLCSLLTVLKEIDQNWTFHYPSISGNNLVNNKELSLIQMFSKYMFIKTEETRKDHARRKSIVIFFDDVSYKNLRFMYDAFKRYQLQDANEFVFYLYAHPVETRTAVSEFKRDLDIELSRLEFPPTIEIKFMTMYSHIPPELIKV